MKLYNKALELCDYIDKTYINEYYRKAYGCKRDITTKEIFLGDLLFFMIHVAKMETHMSDAEIKFMADVSGFELNRDIIKRGIESEEADFAKKLPDSVVIFKLYGNKEYLETVIDAFREVAIAMLCANGNDGNKDIAAICQIFNYHGMLLNLSKQ